MSHENGEKNYRYFFQDHSRWYYLPLLAFKLNIKVRVWSFLKRPSCSKFLIKKHSGHPWTRTGTSFRPDWSRQFFPARMNLPPLLWNKGGNCLLLANLRRLASQTSQKYIFFLFLSIHIDSFDASKQFWNNSFEEE